MSDKEYKDRHQIAYIIYVLISILFASFFIFASSSIGAIVMLLITGLLFLTCLLQNGGKIIVSINKVQKYMLAFGLYCIVTCLWAYDKGLALSKGVTIIEILICISVVMCAFEYDSDSENHVDALLKVILCGSYILMFYLMIVYGSGRLLNMVSSGTRIPSDIINSNTLGLVAAITAIINLYYILNDRFHVWNILIIVSIAFIAVSNSRKAFVYIIVGTALLLILNGFQKKNGFNRYFKYIAILILVFAIIFFLYKENIFVGVTARMVGLMARFTGYGMIDNSTAVRNRLVSEGMSYFHHHPIFGIGMDNSRLQSYQNLYTHNNYIEMLANGGIVGFAIYYSIYLYLLVVYIKNWKYRDKEYDICFTLLMLNLVMDYGMVSYYSKQTYFYLLLLFYYSQKLIKNKKSNSL